LKITDTEVTKLYESVLITLKKRVTLNHYLPIFITKRVRQLFITGLVAQSGLISAPLSGGL
jgi:hypothetical protein